MARGKPRLATTHWEQGAAVEMAAALKAHEELQREHWASLNPGRGLQPVREEVSKDVECLVEAALAVLRFLWFTQPGLRKSAETADRLIRIGWGDTDEWNSIQLYQRDHCVQPIVLSEHNSKIVRSYFDVGDTHFRASFITLHKHFTATARYLDLITAAWTAEVDGFLSCLLRKQAQAGHRSAWFFLQHRAAAFSSGIRGSEEMRKYLIRGLEKYLNNTRRRSGISGPTYARYFDRLQRFLPPGFTAPPRPDLS
ncbi:hypothetical protein JCM8097_006094 [Rhodosporidiobolus ruineniae]